MERQTDKIGTIKKCHDGYYEFRMEIDDRSYYFNVDYVPLEHQHWFCEVLSRILLGVRERATELEADRFKDIFKTFTDVFK